MDQKGTESTDDKAHTSQRNVPLPAAIVAALILPDEVTKKSFRTTNTSMEKEKGAGIKSVDPQHRSSATRGVFRRQQGNEQHAKFASDEVRPGAIRVDRINREPQAVAEEAKDDVGDTGNPTTAQDSSRSPPVVAEVIDEGQLLRELNENQLLRELLARNLVLANATPAATERLDEPNGLPASNENAADEGGTKHRCFPMMRNKSRTCAVLLVVLIVLAVVATVIGVLQSKKPNTPSTPGQNASTAPISPTMAPFARQHDYLRSVLLNNSVSSREDLDNPSTFQYRALNWSANEAVTATAETIIERYVLAVLYYSTNGDRWTDSYSFLSAGSICNWRIGTKGVSCSGSNVLQELVLANNALSGTIPSEIAKLSGVTTLDLYRNQLTGMIPTELGMLTSLNSLHLFYNRLTRGIPTELGLLSSLTTLDLGGNTITGTIPTKLGQLLSLDRLILGGNEINGTIPSELGKLSILTYLDLSSNAMTGTVPAVLSALSNLENLYLFGNHIIGNLTAIFCNGSPSLSEFESDCNSNVHCSCCKTPCI